MKNAKASAVRDLLVDIRSAAHGRVATVLDLASLRVQFLEPYVARRLAQGAPIDSASAPWDVVERMIEREPSILELFDSAADELIEACSYA